MATTFAFLFCLYPSSMVKHLWLSFQIKGWAVRSNKYLELLVSRELLIQRLQLRGFSLDPNQAIHTHPTHTHTHTHIHIYLPGAAQLGSKPFFKPAMEGPHSSLKSLLYIVETLNPCFAILYRKASKKPVRFNKFFSGKRSWITYTVRKILADFAVYDVWHYFKALCDVKFSKNRGKGSKI